jgi:polyphenol oxidase
MQRVVHHNGVITYTFDSLLDQPVCAHVSTRHGGISPAPWNTLNFSILRGDDPARVQQNRERLAAALGLEAATIVHCRQIHSTGIAKVDWSDAGQWQEDMDGLITDAVGLPISLLFADCVPILIYDPVQHALGICHAGWRGTVNGMTSLTLWALQAAYDTDPATVIACLGPSIGPASYQVGEEVIALAQAKLPNADRLFSFGATPTQNPTFDLWQANADQLSAAGVPANQLEISGIDTAQNTHEFFSHRAEQGQCGLFSMTAWLQPKPLLQRNSVRIK